MLTSLERVAVNRAFDTPPVDVGPGYDRLGDAMRCENIARVRYWRITDSFSVELDNGFIGVGPTIREAVRNAAPVTA